MGARSARGAAPRGGGPGFRGWRGLLFRGAPGGRQPGTPRSPLFTRGGQTPPPPPTRAPRLGAVLWAQEPRAFLRVRGAFPRPPQNRVVAARRGDPIAVGAERH